MVSFFPSLGLSWVRLSWLARPATLVNVTIGELFFMGEPLTQSKH